VLYPEPGVPQWHTTFAGKYCLIELQIPCCGVLSAGPSFEREEREELRDLGTMNMKNMFIS
jgi:hypothetical protein